MLVVQVLVNDNPIEELWIQNKGEYHRYQQGKMANPIFIYQVIKPERFAGVEVLHQRSQGYRPLLTQVLAKIDRIEKKEKK